jgi:hypothetical protein
MQVDLPEMSSADAIAIAGALDDLPPRVRPLNISSILPLLNSFFHSVGLLVLPLEANNLLAEVRPLCIPLLLPYVYSFSSLVALFHFPQLRDKQGRPMIKIKSSQKSVTPPASEAYNEEGEEEKEGEDEEEEAEEAPPCPAKRRRTAPALPKSKTPGKSKGKGKAQVETPALPDISTTFPIPVRKTRGKSKKAELPPYVPPQPVPLTDTVSLAAETLASQRCEPLVVSFEQSRLLNLSLFLSLVQRGMLQLHPPRLRV